MYLPLVLVFSLMPFRNCVSMVSKHPFVASTDTLGGGGGFKDCVFLDIPKLGEMIEKKITSPWSFL